MANWLYMFRPETYAKVREHGTVGVRDSARKAFAKVKLGDRFVAYVSRDKVFDGYGHVTSDVFEDDTRIFGGDDRTSKPYRHRCRVDFDRTDAALPPGERMWHLSAFGDLDTTTPTNLMFCKGGFIEISDSDFDNLRRWLDGGEWNPGE